MNNDRSLSIVLALVSVLTPVLLRAQQPPPSTPSIHQLYEEDQKDREAENPDWGNVNVHDKQHRELVRKMLHAGVLKTGQDFEEAAFIFQHGDTAQDYMLAHILAMSAMAKGRTRARWIAAATLDRYLQSIKQPQVFGTQYKWDGPSRKDATQQPYDQGLVSDALRKEFCVTSFANQQHNLEAARREKDFPFPDRCPKSEKKP
jgi:hypothetical protein